MHSILFTTWVEAHNDSCCHYVCCAEMPLNDEEISGCAFLKNDICTRSYVLKGFNWEIKTITPPFLQLTAHRTACKILQRYK